MSKNSIATQRGVLYGEIYGGEVKEFTAESNGKTYKSYTIKMKEKDTGFIFQCNKLREVGKAESSGLTSWLDQVEQLAIQASSLVDITMKAVLRLYPRKSKKGDLIQYDWVTTDMLDDGGLITKINATPKVIVDQKEILEYEANSSSLVISMIVDDIDTDALQIKFTNAEKEYKPKITYAYIPEKYADMIDKYEIGSGYECKLGFKKGTKIAVEEGKFDFGEKDAKVAYEPNKLMILGTAFLKNLKDEDVDGTNDPF